MAITERDRAAWKALPEVVVKVKELSTAGYFALLNLRGSLPQAAPETMLEVRQATLGMKREAQLGLLMKGIDELVGLGVCVPNGRNADGELSYKLYPKVRVVSELLTVDELKKTQEALEEAASDGLG